MSDAMEAVLRLPTEADLDRAEADLRRREAAEAAQPMPAEIDLFGERTMDVASRRKMESARNQLAFCRRKYALVGINPIDIAFHNCMRAQAAGDYDKATEIALALAPYFAPRLSAMAVQAPAGSNGVMRFTWEAAEAAPEAGGP
jgi:hypothetical protein